jgi:hypothetical protein
VSPSLSTLPYGLNTVIASVSSVYDYIVRTVARYYYEYDVRTHRCRIGYLRFTSAIWMTETSAYGVWSGLADYFSLLEGRETRRPFISSLDWIVPRIPTISLDDGKEGVTVIWRTERSAYISLAYCRVE